MALRSVFLTHHQRLNCVDVFISTRTAAARTPVDCSELCQIQQPAECCSSSYLYPETLLETAERSNLYIHTDFKIFSSTELRHVKRQCDA